MIGDVFSNLMNDADIGDLDMHLLQKVRLELNNIQQQVASLSTWMGPGTIIDQHFFQSHSAGFSVLPHECAAMYQSTAQSIPDGTDTTLAPYDSTSAATWGEGMKIDATNGYIYVSGLARETVILIIHWGVWAGSADGTLRDVKLFSDQGQIRTDRRVPIGANAVYAELIHPRRVPSAETYYYIKVNQDTGGNLNYDNFGLFIARLR